MCKQLIMELDLSHNYYYLNSCLTHNKNVMQKSNFQGSPTNLFIQSMYTLQYHPYKR